MNIVLHLPPETEAKLLEQARVTGQNVEALVLEALHERLDSAEPAPASPVSTEEWLQLFDDWVGSHESRNPRVDDSRESMYPDR